MWQRLIPCIAIVAILTSESYQNEPDKKVLSRRKRYLIFPSGSSLQLVFCMTIPTLGMGNIFSISTTAALAWELPHESTLPYKKHNINSASAVNRIDFMEESSLADWNNINTSPAFNPIKTYYNPITSDKFSIIDDGVAGMNNKQLGFNSWRNNNNNVRSKASDYNNGNNRYNSFELAANPAVTSYVHPIYHEIYKRTRRDLYAKLDKLLTSLSMNGKECLLKSVCEVSKQSEEHGTFMEEILKAVFRIKPSANHANEDEYDEAFNKQHNCSAIFPGCESSLWQTLLMSS